MTLRLDSKQNQPSPSITLKKRLTKSHHQLKDQRHLITLIDVSRIDPGALQVARHALGVDPNRRDCPASNDTCHGCGKQGHWKQVCRASPIHVVSVAATSAEANQQDFIVTHEVYRIQATATKGIYVDLNVSSTSAPRPLRFQVDSGCSCNTIHINDLKQLPPTQVHPSKLQLLDYSKSIIPTKGQVTLPCTRRGVPYDIVAQVITAQQYYAPLLGLADSTRMGILKYNVDNAHKLDTASEPPTPPPGELTFDNIKSAYPHLFNQIN